MKKTAIIGTLLTFLSLLLVLSATVIFLWQGRAAWRDTATQLEGDKQRLGDTLWSTEAELATREAALATTAAGGVALEGTLAAVEATSFSSRLRLRSRVNSWKRRMNSCGDISVAASCRSRR